MWYFKPPFKTFGLCGWKCWATLAETANLETNSFLQGRLKKEIETYKREAPPEVRKLQNQLIVRAAEIKRKRALEEDETNRHQEDLKRLRAPQPSVTEKRTSPSSSSGLETSALSEVQIVGGAL